MAEFSWTRSPVSIDALTSVLSTQSDRNSEKGVLLFADKTVSYEDIFKVLDRIRMAGLSSISLQAVAEPQQ